MEDLDRAADGYMERRPSGLDRFLTDFRKAREIMSIFPNAGRERPELREALRSYSVHPFVVFHTVDDERRRVIIERVLHGHLDIDFEDFS